MLRAVWEFAPLEIYQISAYSCLHYRALRVQRLTITCPERACLLVYTAVGAMGENLLVS